MSDESRDFEYDEDTESDESFEAESDESDEAESDESFEAESDESFESDEDTEADESYPAYEASDEGEADEAESDESDEALDEAAVSASAQLRATQARNRQARWRRQMAAAHQREVKRAVSTQRSLTNQLRSIRVGGPTRVSTVGALQGAGVVTAVLPNGRRSRMRIIPTVAPVAEVNRLRAVVLANEKRQAAATGRNSKAISGLASAQAAAVKKLTEQQLKSDKDLSKRIVEGDTRLDKRITKELSGGTSAVHGKRMMRMLKKQRQRQLWNNVLLATSAPFFAAYGERSKPFAKNNVILTTNLMFWMLSDNLLDLVSGKSRALKGGANLLSYLAFAGNGATAYLLLDKKQHERYVSGISAVPAGGTVKISLTNGAIAKKSIDDFKKEKHGVVATILDPAGPGTTANEVRADVTDGVLTLTVEPAAAANVAWIVDAKPTPTVVPAA